ncbi:PAC2 family protein [Georgenia sp. 311]|uniref:PAC2 family protein n=1 Tax=Georgenia wutianyii TaxID=2585135 RepID=A0ABX5VKY0_9MICO|nr:MULTISPECIES: PAC2 family protein [Georgenia]QDB79122.1 PAC2 family protein [Georgenia wutianyii]TNC17057.1 PAC2 family protein [Georgenia sp. 311]
MTDAQDPSTAPDEGAERTPAILLAAFEGWNDAGSAASQALELVAEAWGAQSVHELDPQDFHDFQVNRPVTMRDEDGARVLKWPTTTISVTRSPVAGRTVLLVQGIEPSFRWLDFCDEILDVAQQWDVGSVVGIGALLADVPHTRPVPCQVTSDDPGVQALLGVEGSEYEGPSGIVGVLAQLAQERGMHAMSLWAAVPHYVAQPPSPKASLALLGGLEELVGEPLPLGELVEEARAWQAGVDELAEQDPEVAEYVQQLEEAKDTAELPEATGEAIAREFERYLRRRDNGGGAQPPGAR